ncbi:hypothetical protein FRC19_007847 [Serendipita sp. 401]|nr:hypothetical protein FRC19_007847 [Serendipita sp. 401]
MSSYQTSVPEHLRKAIPAYAQAWGDDVDYPAPGLVTDELRQNIDIDSIFVKEGELIIPDKCEECRLRGKGCDRARTSLGEPLCGRCRKVGKRCIPVTSGYTRLRKIKGNKSLPARVWGQSEDATKAGQEQEHAEGKQEQKVHEDTKIAAQTKNKSNIGMKLDTWDFDTTSENALASPSRKRKRESSPPTQAHLYCRLPPSKGHYIDYSTLSFSFPDFATKTVASMSDITPWISGKIPIDPQLSEPNPLPHSVNTLAKRPKLRHYTSPSSSASSVSKSSGGDEEMKRCSSVTSSGYTTPATPDSFRDGSNYPPSEVSSIRDSEIHLHGVPRTISGDSSDELPLLAFPHSGAPHSPIRNLGVNIPSSSFSSS